MTLNIEDFVEAAEQDGLEASDIPPAVQERLNNALADLTGGDNPTAGGDDAELANLVVSAANGNDDDGSSPFATIGAALDAASADDVIFVEPGTYGQSTDSISVDKSVTLASSDGPDGTTVESQIVVSADDATLDGLTVSPPDASANGESEAIRVDTGNGVTIENNIVEDFDRSGGSGFWGPDAINVLADNGTIEDVTVSSNEIRNVRNNDVYGFTGISIQDEVDGATVTDNTLSNLGSDSTSYGFGIIIRGNDGGVSPANVTVRNNEIDGVQSVTGDDLFGVGLAVEGASESSYTFADNTVNNAELGIEIKTGDPTLDNNSFAGTDVHLAEKTAQVNLTDELSTNDFGEAAATDSINFDDYEQAIFTNISDAVANATTGAQIDVAPGTYDEAVDIGTEGLTLKGPNAGIAGDVERNNEGIVEGQIDISVSDVTVDGLQITPDSSTFEDKPAAGVIVTASNATVENNRVADFEIDITNISVNSIQGIQMYEAGTRLTGIEILDNSVENITYSGSPQAPDGSFGDDYGNLYGVHVQGNIGEASVEGNSLANLASDGYTLAMAVSGTDSNPDTNPESVTVVNNTLEGISAEGLPATGFRISSDRVDASNVSVNQNSLDVPVGVSNGASELLDATDNYWGSEDGPSGGVEDPETGIEANGNGAEVSENVHFDPFAQSSDPNSS